MRRIYSCRCCWCCCCCFCFCCCLLCGGCGYVCVWGRGIGWSVRQDSEASDRSRLSSPLEQFVFLVFFRFIYHCVLSIACAVHLGPGEALSIKSFRKTHLVFSCRVLHRLPLRIETPQLRLRASSVIATLTKNNPPAQVRGDTWWNLIASCCHLDASAALLFVLCCLDRCATRRVRVAPV